MTARMPPKGLTADDVANTTTGWLLGHEVAQGHEGFPGDPLPDGHLGSPPTWPSGVRRWTVTPRPKIRTIPMRPVSVTKAR